MMSRSVFPLNVIPGIPGNGAHLDDYPLLAAFIRIWAGWQDAFLQSRTHLLCLSMALGYLTAFGRRTISRSICARGEQFQDWSHIYRFFSMDKWSPFVLEHKTLCNAAAHLRSGAPLVVAIDDTSKRKTGRHIPTTGYFYDPKSPPFARTYSWALRLISITLILTPYGDCGPARGIPIRLELAPTMPKPKRKDSPELWAQYRRAARNWSLATLGAEQIGLIRAEMDGEPELASRRLVVVGDSSYCNAPVLRNLPARTIFIGRTRKDLRLFGPPQRSLPGAKGRPKQYGDPLPAPEQVRQDDHGYPWETYVVFAARSWHTLRCKTIAPVYWKNAGPSPLRLIVIAPLGYRLTKKSKMLYKDPAYLLISDTEYPVYAALQHYFHRWEIEVNHRDEKSVMGVGQAQVWNPRSVARQPPTSAMLYSSLLLASLDAYGPGRGNEYLPRAKWRNDPAMRPSALDLVAQLRSELWFYESGLPIKTFSSASSQHETPAKYAEEARQWLADTIPKGLSGPMLSSILYADA